MPVVSITEALPEAATAVSLTALTRSDTGLTPAGVVLPLAFTNQGGGTAWGLTFTDPAALPPRYDFIFRITWPDTSFSDVSSSLMTGGAVGFWTSQAAVQQVYGVDNTALDANLSDDGTGTAAVWQRAIDNTDARMDLLLASYLKARPAAQSGTAYTFASRVAAAQVRYDLHKGRGQTESNPAGGPNAGGVYKREADDLWAELEEYLEAQVMDFPDVVDAAGEITGTAPQILRPTIDAEGRPLAVAGQFDRPYYDSNLGAYRW